MPVWYIISTIIKYTCSLAQFVTKLGSERESWKYCTEVNKKFSPVVARAKVKNGDYERKWNAQHGKNITSVKIVPKYL